MKQAFIGTIGGSAAGAWTVRYSCDGVTAGTAGDGVDRWGAAYTPANIVRGAAAAARSWIVMRSPTLATGSANGGVPMTVEVLISFGDSAVDYNAVIAYSKTGFTGGTATVNPSATDMWGGFSVAPTTSAAIAYSSGARSNRLHALRSSSGDLVLFGVNVGAVGRADFGLVVAAPVGCKASDVYPVFTTGYYQDNAEVFSATQFGVSANGPTQIRTWTGGTGVGLAGPMIPVTSYTGPDSADANKVIDLPSWILCQITSGALFTRGRLADIGVMPSSIGSTPVATGSTIRNTVTNAIEYVTVGNWILPFNAAPDMT